MGREEVKLTRHPQAEEELHRAVDRYEERAPGIGREFLDAVIETTERIRRLPGIGAKLSGRAGELGVRRSLVPGFPYSIVYREVDRLSIQVIAVAHDRRRPGYWQERLTGSEDP